MYVECSWYCLCLHHFSLLFLLFSHDCPYGSTWTDQSLPLVCLLPVCDWLFSFHLGGNLLQIFLWALCVSLFPWLHILFGHSDSKTSTIMVICSMSYYHTMHPQSSIFSLHYYSWPCRGDGIFLWVSMFWLTLGCLSNSVVWLLSVLSHTTSWLWNLGIMHLVSLLSRSIARLGNLGLIGVNLICSKAIYTCQY